MRRTGVGVRRDVGGFEEERLRIKEERVEGWHDRVKLKMTH